MTKPALQALLIAPDDQMRANILSGVKKISIREGHRDYKTGPMMICCHIEPWAVQVDVTEVFHRTLDEVSFIEWEADGFTSQQDLLDGLRSYYPNITLDSPVTVIYWDNARGKLVDAA